MNDSGETLITRFNRLERESRRREKLANDWESWKRDSAMTPPARRGPAHELDPARDRALMDLLADRLDRLEREGARLNEEIRQDRRRTRRWIIALAAATFVATLGMISVPIVQAFSALSHPPSTAVATP